MEEQVQNNPETTNPDVTLSQLTIENLRKTAPWLKFISILGFISCGFIVLAAIISLFAFSIMGSLPGMGSGAITFIFYIIVAVLVFFPNKYLFNYARGLKSISKSQDNSLIDEAFLMQKKYWKFIGILVIIYLSLITLALIAFSLGSFLR